MLRNFLKKNLSQKQKKIVRRKIKKAYIKLQKIIDKLYSYKVHRQIDIIFSRLVSNRLLISFFYRIPRFSYINLFVCIVFPITGMSIFADLHRKDPFRRPYSRFIVFAGYKFLNRVLFLQNDSSLIDKIKIRISKIVEIEYLFESYLRSLAKNQRSWTHYFREQLLLALASPEFYCEEQLYNCLLRLALELPDKEMEFFKSQLPEQVIGEHLFFLGPAVDLRSVGSSSAQSQKIVRIEDVNCISGYKFYKNQLLLDAKVNPSSLDEYTFGEVVQLAENKFFVFVKMNTKNQKTIDSALLVPEFRKGFFYFFLDKTLRMASFEEQQMAREIPVLIQKKLDWEVKNSLKDDLQGRHVVSFAEESVVVKNAFFALHEDFEHLEEKPFILDSVAKEYLFKKLFEREDLKAKFDRKKICLSFKSKDNHIVDSALELLERQGFEFYDDSLLTLMERLALFYFSQTIVMPVGSQLALMAFLGSRTQLHLCIKNEDLVLFKRHFSFFDGNMDHVSYLDLANFSQTLGATHA